MKKYLRRVLIVIFAVIFLSSGGVLIARLLDYQKGGEIYSEAETMAELPDFSKLPPPTLAPVSKDSDTNKSETPDPPAESGQPEEDPYSGILNGMDFTALREINPDVLGWLLIPGTGISYPLLQHGDNDYYLHHTWNNISSSVGAIFMDYRCNGDLNDFNTIIYGHRMRNGSMFGALRYYNSQEHWEQFPCVYIVNSAGTYKYDIFASYEVSVQGITYERTFPDAQSKQTYISDCTKRTVINTGIAPTADDQILTLSTCTGNGHSTRWIVQAVLRDFTPYEPAQDSIQNEP